MKTYTSVIAIMLFLNIQHSRANYFFTVNDTTVNNRLTQKEKQEGWKLLFDGSTLNSWRTYKNQPGAWKVNQETYAVKYLLKMHMQI